MRVTAIVWGLMVVFSACSNNKKVPKEFIQPDKWQAVIYDIVTAERFVQDYLRDSTLDGRKRKAMEMYNTIFAIHGISKKQFFESLEFYLSRPDISNEIFSKTGTYGESLRTIYQERRRVLLPVADEPVVQ
jgi:hypothetical protein